MIVIHDAVDSGELPSQGVATIGNYDGIHRGQRAILDRVVARAKELGVPSVVLTFDPHPIAILRPEAAPLPLATAVQKERWIAEAGVDYLLVVRFTKEFSKTPADVFVRNFLARELAVKEIWVGASFAFGRNREGTLRMLTELGTKHGFVACPVEEVQYRGERISSTRIRRAIVDGKVAEAAEMLGRPFSIAGSIARGDRMGQKLGWPTINLAPESRLLPADGVYAGRVFFPNYPATFDCVTNVGTRPTVYENYQRVVESHVLDFDADVYGEKAELSFCKRLREERIFPSVMDLSAQIGRDVEATRDYFHHLRSNGSRDSAEPSTAEEVA
jgi:riboflavin kinase / FMN adenylyltransferase